jgi:hypothetical protein
LIGASPPTTLELLLLECAQQLDLHCGGGQLQSRAGVASVITSEKMFALGGASTATDTTFGITARASSASERENNSDRAGVSEATTDQRHGA